jgi:hypothetical protein
MSASLVIEGLAELLEEMRRLPTDLVAEATPVVLAAGNRALDSMHYPERTGKLARGNTLEVTDGGPFGVSVLVKNTAKHAWVFENGSQARHTELGANRGSMPPGHVFVPAMERSRRQMYADLGAVVASHGLTVSGDAT